MARLALLLLGLLVVAPACGDEESKPVDPALVVKAEDGTKLRGTSVLETNKGNPLLIALTLSASVPPKKGKPESFRINAVVSREKVLTGTLELEFPGDATYTTQHGAGPNGTITLHFAGGRIDGTAVSDGGAKASFEGDLDIECMVDPEDLKDPPKVPFGQQVNDTELETRYCNPLRALR